MDDSSSFALVSSELKLLGGLNERLFNLLAAVQETGSINQAAKRVGLTYKGAWEMLERANNLSPKILVLTAIGGVQGGGTQLTPAGKTLLEIFRRLQQQQEEFLAELNRSLAQDREMLFLLKRLIMKASARNQFFGKVSAVSVGGVNVEVAVTLKGGATLVSTITKTSADELGIRAGIDVIALVKAPQILLITDFSGYRLSARNQLKGTVSRIQLGAVNAEVIVELDGGDVIAAIITNDSIENLGLAVGNAATAVFKAGAVILGVPG